MLWPENVSVWKGRGGGGGNKRRGDLLTVLWNDSMS